MSASRLRFVQFGMSSSRSGLTEEIRAALPGVEVITGYGATEYGPVTRTYSWEFDAAGDPVGVGRPVAGADLRVLVDGVVHRSEEHTSELQSLMRNSYAVFCLKK